MIKTDNNYFNNFSIQFPLYAEEACDFESTGPLEIMVTLLNGNRYIYDDLDKTLMYIGKNSDKDFYKSELSRRLKKRIYMTGITQEELSNKLDISRRTLNGYLNGSVEPPISIIKEIAKTINCKLSDLVDF